MDRAPCLFVLMRRTPQLPLAGLKACLPLALFALVLSALVLAAPPRAETSSSDDRLTAEWVIRSGGSVMLPGHRLWVWDLAGLPSGPGGIVRLSAVNLVDTNFTAAEIQRIGSLTG